MKKNFLNHYFSFLVIGLMAISLLSCTNDDDCCFELPQDRKLAFGTYFGFCLGECIHIYKIENEAVFQMATSERVNLTQELDFVTAALPGDAYETAKPLLENFPDELLAEEETTIGIPDAYDQGGIYLELTEAGVSTKWFLDSNVSALPEYLQAYAQQIKDVTEQLKGE